MANYANESPCGPCSPRTHARMERFMEPCLLLLLRGQRSHGYELMEKLRELGFEGSSADMASLYRTLRQLEDKQVVTSSWEEGTQGPPKRVYELTEEGEALLHDWARVIRANRSRLNKFLDLYETLCQEEGKGGGSDV
ncbi:MAG: PadR family transcriptional regulator [Firmicutes bacterium]|nr:PadR family transcriptional regulator [Bacillota bacterium]